MTKREDHVLRFGILRAGKSRQIARAMKLIIQIPCFNEAEQLPQTLADLPREVAGFDEVERLVIDDGSSDRTVEVARSLGVEHLVRLTNNKGLAAAFQAGIDTALKLGADVIVNTDADNQYCGAGHPQARRSRSSSGRADMVVGDRQVAGIEHFSAVKKLLQRLGSWVVRQASSTSVPDTTSGFRAYNREAAIQMMVVSRFTYTLETIIQAGKLLVAVDHVPVRTNPKTRESRLFPSMGAYVRRNAVSIFRIYAQYEPLRVFWSLALVIGVAAVAVWIRFVVAYAEGSGKGHVQSLILGAVLFIAAVVLWALGVIGDLLAAQRVMTQRSFERIRRIELALGDRALALRTRHAGRSRTPRSPRAGGRARDAAGARRASPTSPPSAASRTVAAVSGVTVSADGIVTGNTFDKYGSSNPLVRRMMSGFERSADELFDLAAPDSVLDVGCGEGVLVQRWAQRLPGRPGSSASTSKSPRSRRAGASTRRPTSSTASWTSPELPFADGEFELASAMEVLEHLPDPERMLAEMARCASRHLLVSVPREPHVADAEHGARRLLVARGATPPATSTTGRRRSLRRAAGAARARCVEMRSPFPWTMVLVSL